MRALNYFYLLCLSLVLIPLLAESQPVKTEVGFQFDIFNGIGDYHAVFKKERKPFTYRRIRAKVDWTKYGIANDTTLYKQFGVGFSWGIEKRDNGNYKIHGYWGPEFTMEAYYRNEGKGFDKKESFRITPEAGIVAGAVFGCADRWYFSLELYPALQVGYFIYNYSGGSRFSDETGLDINGFQLSFIWRFVDGKRPEG